MSFFARDKGPSRHEVRVTELLAHLAAEFVARTTNGTSLITVTRAELTAHGSGANVFVSVFPETSKHSALEFLNRNAGEFREYIRGHARMRELPRITFMEDPGEQARRRLDELGNAS